MWTSFNEDVYCISWIDVQLSGKKFLGYFLIDVVNLDFSTEKTCTGKKFLGYFLIDVVNLDFSTEKTCTVASSIPG